MKKPLFASLATVILATVCALPVGALSDEQKSAVSANCSSIKQSLRTLQRSDSRTRVYLGSIYQIILTNYMAPLNIRLAKNNQPSAELSSDQSDFTAARDDASQKFITYSQSLEELLLVDCTNNPEQFYDKLTETRKKRDDLSQATEKVKNILNRHMETVTKLAEDN